MSAAVALTFGLDPLWVLGRNPEDYQILAAVITEAQTQRDQYARGLADYQSGKTAGMTVRGITRWLRRALSP